MCGIIGYKGGRNAAEVVLAGLKKLEYRGYDSWGVAINTNPELKIVKAVGKLENLPSTETFGSGVIGVGHTRWATHGAVTEKNAHPQLSNNKEIAVVHNGIIENYQELKKFLIENEFKFYSETDTEVIPNLIEFYMRHGKDFVAAAKLAIKKLEGSYAIVAVHSAEKKILAARKESPLVIGVGDNEWFIASDIPSFLEFTKNITYLAEKDFVVISDDIKIYNLDSDLEVQRPIDSIAWDTEAAKKGNFDHFMLKEITEQADVISRALNQGKEKILEVVKLVKNAKGVYLIGCGTAYHACLAASYKFAKLAKRRVRAVLASEFPYFEDMLSPESLVIAVSQSGETADVLAAVQAAKTKGCKIVSICNVMGSSLIRESDKIILQNAGPEIGVLATKSYTSQLVILTLLAYALADRYEEGKESLRDLTRHVYHLTAASTRTFIKNLAEKLRYVQHIYTIGRGLQYPTALEAALKIKEVSYIHAEGFAGGELKHGSIALIEAGTPCIVFVSEDTEKEILSNAMELKARGAYIIGISSKNNEIFDFFIKVREAEEANSICQIAPIQILAYQLAILRGCDPDRPRNLAKSVTVK